MQLRRVTVEVRPFGDTEVGEGAGEDQGLGAFGPGCREQHRCGSALAQPEQHGTAEPRGVHHGLDLCRPFIERAYLRDGVRQPDAGLVEQQHAAERRDPLHEGLELRHGPEQLKVADEGPGIDELDGPVSEYLVGETQTAAWCV